MLRRCGGFAPPCPPEPGTVPSKPRNSPAGPDYRLGVRMSARW